MSNKISFKDFLQLVDDTYNHYSFELRYGQTIMNTMYNVWPEKYKELVASEEDCFYSRNCFGSFCFFCFSFSSKRDNIVCLISISQSSV